MNIKTCVKGCWLSIIVLACSATHAMAKGYHAGPEMLPGAEQMPLKQLEKKLPDAHPVNYFGVSQREYLAGHKDKAVFWYYVAQIRYRFYLLSNPQLPPGGDPALFTAMQDVVGRSVNRYAGGHLDQTVKEIDAALKWDADHKNGFTPKSDHAKEWRDLRAQIVKLKTYFLTHKKQIHEQREAAGIAEDETGGVGVREPMPSKWPQLKPRTDLKDIAGKYEDDVHSLLDAIFFYHDRKNVALATAIEIRSVEPSAILVIAWNGSKKIAQKQIPVQERRGAIVFKEKDPGVKRYRLPPTTTVIYIRTNEKNQLVVQRDIYDEYKDRPKSKEPTYTFWNRAMRLCGKDQAQGC